MADKKPPFRVLEGTNQNITVAGTSAATTNAFSNGAVVLRLATTTDCYIAVGASPTATTSHAILPAGTIDHILVEPSEKVAALQVTAGGVLSVTECSR